MQIMKHSKTFVYIALGIMSFSLILILAFGLQLGIDFTGGSILEFKVDESVSNDDAQNTIRIELENLGLSVNNLYGSNGYYSAETETLTGDQSKEVTSTDFGENITLENLESIGSVIGSETVSKSITAVIVSLVAMLLYIAYAFRNIPAPYSSYKFGYSALFAMVHDVFVVLAVFAVLGKVIGLELDLLFVTAVLTIIGFSVNDTIVVFDRVRENLKKFKGRDLSYIVNISVLETMRRSIGISTTLLFVLFALFIFGGESIKYFVLAFIVGVIAGTYSSIFVASPFLVVWEEHLFKKPTKSFLKKKKTKSVSEKVLNVVSEVGAGNPIDTPIAKESTSPKKKSGKSRSAKVKSARAKKHSSGKRKKR